MHNEFMNAGYVGAASDFGNDRRGVSQKLFFDNPALESRSQRARVGEGVVEAYFTLMVK